MIIEHPIPPIIDFLGKNGLIWLLTLFVLAILVSVVGLLVSVARYGSFSKGFSAFASGAVDILEELFTYTFYLFPCAVLLILGLMSIHGAVGYFGGIRDAIHSLVFQGNIANTLDGFCLFSLLFALLAFAVNFIGWSCAGFQQRQVGKRGTFADIFDEIGAAWRRVWAIARLAIKESLRRRVLFIFLVFLVILMFAGWFLDQDATDPAAVYLAFVMSMSTYLLLLLALFLSAFSLPNDIKSKTIYTIVTKPVRSSEIVLGRMLGFGIVGTVLLCGMALLSYLFVSFQLQHDHTLTQKDLVAVKFSDEELANLQASGEIFVTHTGTTRIANGHRHVVTMYSDGVLEVDDANNHGHTGTWLNPPKAGESPAEDEPMRRFEVGKSLDILQARVPRYAAAMVFRDDEGIDRTKGIDVGHEWGYRSYIGSFNRSTDNAGVWTLEGITENRFPDGLPVEMTLGVYRSYKGDMEKRIQASLSVRNPETGLHLEAVIFPTDKFITRSLHIPTEFRDVTATVEQRKAVNSVSPAGGHLLTPEQPDYSLANKRNFDLFEDFVTSDGKLEIWLRCLDNQQFIGAGFYDLYLREADAAVVPNFFKGYFGIWMQMLMVIAFGVLLSTFLGGPVTMVSLFGVMIAGFSRRLLLAVALGENLGGGALESLMRMLTQQNLMEDMDKGMGQAFIIMLDKVSGAFLVVLGQVIPPLYDFVNYETALQRGFDVPTQWLVVHGLTTFGYALPLFLVGYIILKNREVAK
ncbi:MAG: hypothetical protein FWD31_00695 [Planctomycetaceae bacterium]|nr:hypothetical protein [Planctomycetaceae bacterium]